MDVTMFRRRRGQPAERAAAGASKEQRAGSISARSDRRASRLAQSAAVRRSAKRALRLAFRAALVCAAVSGGYLLQRQFGTRVIDVCVVTDLEYRISRPAWQSGIASMFEQTNHVFQQAKVRFRPQYRDEAYPARTEANMARRWALLAEAGCQADMVVGLTGRVDGDDDAVALPFTGAALVKDTGTTPAAIVSGVLARSLANLFGVPVSTRAMVTIDDSNLGLDAKAIEIVRGLRNYDFSRGVAALPGKWEAKAQAKLTDALSGVKPHSEAQAHLIIARGYAGGRRYGDAVRQLREAVRLDSQSPDLHFELAMILQADAELDQAIAELKEAARLDRTNPWPHAATATMLLNSGRIDEAVEEWRAAASLDPRNPSFQTALGEALSTRPGLVKEAARAFETAARLKPSAADATFGLAQQTHAQSELERRVFAAQRRAREAPSSAEAHLLLGIALADAGDLSGARTEVDRSLQLAASYGPAHSMKAELCYLAGDYPAARAEIAAAKQAGAEPRFGLVDSVNRKFAATGR
jgi:Flp pilus assembly protein TadD